MEAGQCHAYPYHPCHAVLKQPCLDWWTALVVLLHLLSISRLVVELSSQRPKPSCPRVVLCVKVLVPCWMPLHSRCLHACLCMHGATS